VYQRLRFGNSVNILVTKYRVWCNDDEALFSSNLVKFGPPLLRSRSWKSTLLRETNEKFANRQ